MSTDVAKRIRATGLVDELCEKFPEIPENEVRELAQRSPSREDCLDELTKISEKYLYGSPAPLDHRSSLCLPTIGLMDVDLKNGGVRTNDSGVSSRSSTPDGLQRTNDSAYSNGRPFSAGVTPDHPLPPSTFARSLSAQAISQSVSKPLFNSANSLVPEATSDDNGDEIDGMRGARSSPMPPINTNRTGYLGAPDMNVHRLSPNMPVGSNVSSRTVSPVVPATNSTAGVFHLPINANYADAGTRLAGQRLYGVSSIDASPVQRNSHRLSDPFVVPESAYHLLHGSASNWQEQPASLHHQFSAPGGEGEEEQYVQALRYYQMLRLSKLREEGALKWALYQSLKAEVAELQDQIKRLHRSTSQGAEPKAADVQRLKAENENLRRQCQLLVRQQDLLASEQELLPSYAAATGGGRPTSQPSPVSTTRTPPPRPPPPRPSSRPPPPPYPQEREEEEEQQWACTKCSFRNHPLMDRCECCETPRIHARTVAR